MDGITRVWKLVYDGTQQNLRQLADSFFTKYCHLCVGEAQFLELPRITDNEFAYTCRHSNTIVAGMGSWDFKDLAFVLEKAVCHLADMLHRIEHGASWLEALLHARAAYSAKDLANPYDPLAYRALILTPIIYRRWASTR